MPHVKQQIRDLVTALLTGLPTAGSRVYPSKRLPWDRAAGQMPGIALYLDAELVSPADKEGRVQRDLSLVIEMAARGDDTAVDDALLAMETEVEQALGANRRLGGLLSHPLTLVRVSPPPPDANTGDATAARRAEYQLRYVTTAADPTVAA